MNRAVSFASTTAFAVAAAAFAVVWLAPAPAEAYVGPGAGVAVATTAFLLLVSLVLAVFGLLLWPLRMAYRLITIKKPPKKPRIKRAVVIGLDGLDPKLARRFMEQGRLPNLQRLANKGMFTPLRTTFPSMSPVAAPRLTLRTSNPGPTPPGGMRNPRPASSKRSLRCA